MQSLVSVNTSRTDAVKTLENLKEAGYNEAQIALVNRDDIVNNHLSINPDIRIEAIETAVCAGLGIAFGILLSTGIIQLKDASFTHFTGMLVALCLGGALGCLMGGIVSLVTFVVMKWQINIRYEHLLSHGQFLIFVEGTPDEINYAEKIAHTEEGLHWQFS
jgi:hypothetical protein